MESKRKEFKKFWRKPIVLKEEDVMAQFGFSKSTIARLRRSGQIPHSKVGGSYFYQEKELKRMLKQKLIKPS